MKTEARKSQEEEKVETGARHHTGRGAPGVLFLGVMLLEMGTKYPAETTEGRKV